MCLTKQISDLMLLDTIIGKMKKERFTNLVKLRDSNFLEIHL